MKNKANFYLNFIKVMTGVSTIVLSMVSVTASAEETNFSLEEIVVTATKRSANLQDVPISVAAMTERRLRESGAENLVDAVRNIAGVVMADLGPGQSKIAIRGFSSGQVLRDESSRKESVGIYLDESSIGIALFTPDLDLFDLSRLEVLRGPQGTLFGSGSISGTVRYITNQPNSQDVEGAVEVSGSTIKNGSEGYSVKSFVNLPISEGKAAVRAVGYYSKWGGFIDALTLDGTVKKDVNDGEKYGGRIAFTFTPNDSLTITPRLVYQRLETKGYPRRDVINFFRNEYTTTRPAGTFGDLEQFLLLQEGTRDDFLMLDMNIKNEFEGVTFTSITSYIDRNIKVTQDGSALTSHVNNVAIGLTGDVLFVPSPLVNRTGVKAISQEIRLSSNDDGPFQWLIGGYYLNQQKEFGQRLDTPGFDTLTAGSGLPATADLTVPLTNDSDVLYISDIPVDHEQFSVFGEASYEMTEKLTATVGLRWFDFQESRSARLLGLFGASDDPLTRDRSTTDSGFNPRFILSYNINDDLKLNLQASKGFRLGGINDPLIAICLDSVEGDAERFGRETVWNYELGAKSTMADGRVRINASAYHMVISGLQVTDRLPCSISVVGNVPKSTITGAEFEFFAKPTENLDLTIVANYNDAKVTEINPNGVIRKGDRLPTSPQFQMSASLAYTGKVSDEMDGYATMTVQYTGSSYSVIADQHNGATLPINIQYGRATGDSLDVNYPTILDAYTLVNARVGIRMGEGWDVALYVNNLLNERANLALDRERGGSARIAYYVNQPRTIGLTARYDF